MSTSDTTLSGTIEIRPAREADVDFMFAMIVGLAEYEKSPESVLGSPELLRAGLFAEHPPAEAVIAELDGERVGFALFHGTFSTWHCQPGLWLEDFFVLPEHRRHGIGERIFRHIAKIAVDRGCSRFSWSALDWNTPALNFYAKMGAEALNEWTNHRLSGDALQAVASGAAAASYPAAASGAAAASDPAIASGAAAGSDPAAASGAAAASDPAAASGAAAVSAPHSS